ncbi:phage protein NinX family protein [Serratia marcescens]|uniref:phage protein NinX family protein n=1 Tax=Serratia marcescens TaxID=615 RepID=UPI00101EB5A2|nr:phage protein NinX family protein [Serratia marcescens]RZF18799.1 hypothetical protein B7L32_03425 [Serratia marcescens]
MTDYSKMSDFEINKGVAESLGYTAQENRHIKDAVEIWRFETNMGDAGDKYHGIRNYCNNPAEAWPIIVENKISLDHLGKSIWGAKAFVPVGEPKPRYAEENPLRAAMICFLMMKDAEKC